MPEPDEHYFQTKAAYEAIRLLAEPTTWAVYVGLGATIDRTNAPWPTFVEKLFLYLDESSALSKAGVARWVREQGPQRAATTAEVLARKRYGLDHWLGRMQSGIHSIMYSPRRFMSGPLLNVLADWSYAIAKNGGSVVLVTANYDEYLHEELTDFQKADWARDLDPVRLVVLGSTRLEEASLPDDWAASGKLTCVHIHGYVPAMMREARGVPVVGELSYKMTAPATRELLTAVFAKSNVLIVGSSVTDPPLVDALIESSLLHAKLPEDDRPVRLAFQPRQGMPWEAHETYSAELDRLNNQRLQAMNVRAITPDYYGQVSQVLIDASTWAFKDDRGLVENEDEPKRYNRRVDKWWDLWFASSKLPSRQYQHFELLEAALPSVRRMLGAQPDERLKIEVWVRWKPGTDRQLGLWACSTGPWPDHPRMIRTGEIGYDDHTKAVQVFRAGSPLLFPEEQSTSRWHTYYGYPIWHGLPDGRFMAGVVMVASMYPSAKFRESCLREDNLQQVQTAALWFRRIGHAIVDHEVTSKGLGDIRDELRKPSRR